MAVSTGVASSDVVDSIKDKQEWERAEIARSRIEARLTPAAGLVADERQVSRYLNPPLDTAYPLEYAYALLGDVRGRTVLDFGCGSGENLLLLARRGAIPIGVDISESLLDLARQRLAANGLAGRARFVVGSAHDLPITANSVDIVLGIAVLHHLDLAASAREVHRVLKPGGRAIFQEPVRNSRVLAAIRSWIPYRAPDVSPFERPLTTPEIQRFTSRFQSARIRAFSLPFVNLVQVVPQLRRFVHAAYALDRRILKRVRPLATFAGGRVFEVTK